MPVIPGLSKTITLTVSHDDTAIAMGTGSVPVLATPRIITLCEEAAFQAVEHELADGDTTVGMQVQLDHLAPTAIGSDVSVDATVEKVNGRRITFTVSVNDERGLVAVGRVTRVVVNATRFLDKTKS